MGCAVKITALKTQVKNADRVSVFVDNAYSFSLTLDQVLETGIKKDDELNESDVKQYQKMSDEGKLKSRMHEWLMGRLHSQKELRDYLYKKKVDKDLIDQWVSEAVEKGYVNDTEFARWFAEGRRRKNKSNREISAELAAKGIDRSVVQSVVEDLEDDEEDALQNLIAKLQNRTRYQDEKKLISYLMGKGYRYSDIKDALNDD